MWNELAMLLRAQITLCDQLLSLGERQRQCLIAGDRKEVVELAKREDGIIRKFLTIENKKQSLLVVLGKKLRAEHGVTLSGLLSLADREVRNGLIPLAENLSRMANELRFFAQRNQRLLNKMMEFVAFNVNLMAGATADDIYAPGAQNGFVTVKKKIFDQSV